MILVSHSMVLIENLTAKCMWLHDGQLRLAGPSGEVASEYMKFSQQQELGPTEGLHDYKLRRGPGTVRLDDFQTLDAGVQRKTASPTGKR